MGGTMSRTSARLAALAMLAGLGTLGLAGTPAAAPAATAHGAETSAAAPGSAAGTARPGGWAARTTAAARRLAPGTARRGAGNRGDIPLSVPTGAKFVAAPHPAAAAGGAREVCPAPTRPGQMTCMSLIPALRRAVTADGPPRGTYSPADLREAYSLTSAALSAGRGETVAIVDAYADPDAGEDLASYRSQYRLGPCTAASGCLKIVGQSGGSGLPATDPSGAWEFEESLDLDMVSAICPKCSILLVEAKTASISNLSTAEVYAARHASVVSNSWGSGAEFTDENAFDPRFDWPGVAIVAAAGDDGYGTQYPAASQFVTAVGGTTLVGATSTSRGTQTAWDGTGSGCSALEPKPSWQTFDDVAPDGCLNRTETDVSAVANPATPVALYDTFGGKLVPHGWAAAGGTSAATAIIAASYALAGRPTPGTYPASYPYLHPGDFRAVTSGSNGVCESYRGYLCDAADDFGGTTYNGPTGLGTPDGTAGLTGPARAVTVVDPGTQDVAAGTQFRLQMRATSTGGAGLSYAASGLPIGLEESRYGLITGAVARAGSYQVTVTASGPVAGASTASFEVVVLPKIADSHPGTGRVRPGVRGSCLDESGRGAVISRCDGSAAQDWAYLPNGDPGGAGSLVSAGKCLGAGPRLGVVGVAPCARSSLQQWRYRSGQLVNPATGQCLDDRAGIGAAVVLRRCGGGAGESWRLPAAAVLSGISGRCLAGASGAAVLARCGGAAAQRWTMQPGGQLVLHGACLAVTDGSMLDGAAIELARCSGGTSQQWTEGPRGELLNAHSGRCLAAPSSGTALTQQDCYGEQGEVWAVS
jgi:hypothetical protein